MRQSHLLMLNAGIMWANQVLVVIPQLILVPYLIGAIGEEGYGVYALVWSLLVSVEQVLRSLQSGVIKYSAGFLAQDRIEDVNKVVTSSLVYSVCLAFVAAAAMALGSLFMSGGSASIARGLAMVALAIVFVVPSAPFIAAVRAKQLFFVAALADTLTKYLGLGLIVVWYNTAAPTVEAAIAIMAIMLVVSKLSQIPIAYRIIGGLRVRPQYVDKQSFKLAAAFGLATVFIALSLAAHNAGIKWLSGMLVSTAFVAHLAIILLPGQLLAQIVSSMTAVIMPATSALDAEEKHDLLYELLIRSVRYSMIIVTCGVAAGVFLLPDVFVLWLGEEYRFLAPFACIVMGCQAVLLTTSAIHHAFKGVGKIRTTLIISIVGYVVIPFSIVVAALTSGMQTYWSLVAGVSAGYIAYALLHLAAAIRLFRLPMAAFLYRAYGQPVIMAAIVFPAAYIAMVYLPVHSIVAIGAVACMALAIYCVGFYAIFATHEERELAMGLLAKIRSRGQAMRAAGDG